MREIMREIIPRIKPNGKISGCPYCAVEEFSEGKMRFFTEAVLNGRCECGANLDIGQREVEVNSYREIYKGALRLIGDIVDQYNSVLEFYDIEIPLYDGEKPNVFLRNIDIVSALFIPYYGMTTLLNFTNALGINTDGEQEWDIAVNEGEEE